MLTLFGDVDDQLREADLVARERRLGGRLRLSGGTCRCCGQRTPAGRTFEAERRNLPLLRKTPMGGRVAGLGHNTPACRLNREDWQVGKVEIQKTKLEKASWKIWQVQHF
jgi:hypothetical protein